METAINKLLKKHQSLFGNNPLVSKINIGFTNTIYNVNDSYIIKICSDKENEKSFKNEINFYKSNKDNQLIPRLYYSDISKNDIPYLYEILEKIKGVSLYEVWHTYKEKERENIIKQLCTIMKKIHSNKGKRYNWTKYIKNKFKPLYLKAKELKIFNEEEQAIIEKAYSNFDKYLDSNEFVLIHNDIHFDNIFVYNNKIKIIDFERSLYAPKDFELDILYRMIRKPWKFASEETEKYTDINQYKNIMIYIEKYYPELIETPNLYERLAIYDIVYYMAQLIRYPKLEELKNDILKASKIIIDTNY